MIDSPGNKMFGLPFGSLKLKEEILSFDGNPMLLHFTNDRQEDVLAYWVDYGNNLIRWLYTKISKSELYLYLSGRTSLRCTFENIKAQYVFLVDVDESGKMANVNMITPYEIPEKYTPTPDSLFTEGLSKFYVDYLTDADFHYNLKERSFIITGKPANYTHSTHYLTAKETAFMLNSLKDSTEGYISVEANNKYEKKWTNKSKINKVVRSLKQHLSPVVTGAEIHSFEVWLSIDTMTLNDLDETGNEIKNEILEGFKKNVLDVDFTSEDDAKIICDRYNPYERKMIYAPIIELLENDQINITISDKLKTIRDTGKPVRINTAFKNLVLPKPSLEEMQSEQEKKKRIFALYLSLDEGTDISRLGKREITNNLLLFNDVIETPYPVNFKIPLNNGSEGVLKKPIIAILKITDTDKLELTSDNFDIDVIADNIKGLTELFKNEFVKYAVRLKNLPTIDLQGFNLLSEYIDLDTL